MLSVAGLIAFFIIRLVKQISKTEEEQKRNKMNKVAGIANNAIELLVSAQSDWLDRMINPKEDKDQVPDWFRQDIMNEYASKGQTPLEHIIQSRWQQESMAREKQEWIEKGETSGTSLTPAQLTKMAEMGIPEDVANDLHGFSLAGYDWDTIYESMKATFGAVQAGKYIDIYREAIRTSGMTMLIPEKQTIEQRSSYEEKAKQEEGVTKSETPTVKQRVWWNPLTW
jgi:hypothetical protein